MQSANSLLPFLCICLFFSCFSDVSEDQLCSVMSKKTGEVIVGNPQCNYPPFSLSLIWPLGMCFSLFLTLVWYPVAIYHCLVHVNPLCINLNFSVRNSGLMCYRQHGAFARVRVNHVDVHRSQNTLKLMGDVGPLILFYLPMCCWLQAVFFLNIMGWSLERGKNMVCSAHPAWLWKFCIFPAVLN